jgi:predicted Zn-ribbon and HTH transcriptional regulator
MVLIWIGIAIGVLITVILIIKAIKTPSHEGISMSAYCKKCGYKTHGLKCPNCDKKSTFKNNKY